MANFLFYFLSVVAVLSGLGVVLARNPVASTLSLLTTFLSMAVIYLLTGFQLLAAIQIMVYAGAIMVLFLFVVMLLNLGDPAEAAYHEPLFHKTRGAVVGGWIAAAMMVVLAAGVLASRLPAPDLEPARRGIDSAQELAKAMFGRYALPFEGISLLLLATAVGVLVLAKRERGQSGEAQSEGAES